MRKLVGWLVVAVVVAGIAGLAVTTERSAAGGLPDGNRFNLTCNQLVAPSENTENPGVGIVECSLLIDLPDFLTPPLPDTIKLTIEAAYADRDGNDQPSPGDRLLCIKVTTPTGTTLVERCRGGIEPPDLSPPNGL